jgi:hypothetical protein
MGGYRAKPAIVMHRVIDMGGKPDPLGLAALTGFSRATAWRVLNGSPVSAPTMAIMVRVLETPVDELFEPIPDRPKLRQVRAAR